MISRTSTPIRAGRSRRPIRSLMRLLRVRGAGPSPASFESDVSCDLFPGQQDEDVLEVRRPALAVGGAAVDAQDGHRRTGAAGLQARFARLALDLGQLRRRAIDLDRLRAGVLVHE